MKCAIEKEKILLTLREDINTQDVLPPSATGGSLTRAPLLCIESECAVSQDSDYAVVPSAQCSLSKQVRLQEEKSRDSSSECDTDVDPDVSWFQSEFAYRFHE
jgi:hypothetical protein